MSEGRIAAEMLADHPGILMVRVENPPLNVMSLDQYRLLAETFDGLEDRKDVRCVVLTAAGERAFIGGADLRQLVDRTPKLMLERGKWARRAFHSVRDCGVPVVCAVNGSAVGAGLVIASVCDVIVASDKAKFALPEITVGLLGGAKHLSRILPEKLVRWMALTGTAVDGEFMRQHGAVHSVVPVTEVLPCALAIAARIAQHSGAISRLLKDCLDVSDELPLREGFRLEQLFTALVSGMPDSAEAANAWLEKRAPRFE
ncbi:enoyl-CoA hydratase-related protein [Hydrogenophaga sp. BPS33]|uniref:enoyl-CoA hydratase-related protein n=1 Tax=Hydrogenophaga sp. BPS33 TaxID=2651974 RepID=UPI00131F9F01|nr:enoyl-CoA hydratase-related protein [Hydrogenophaga sp. BPS33]QHE84775.1 enoyl-CoA hydratase [Hydrogenophaga sp. BPS33]